MPSLGFISRRVKAMTKAMAIRLGTVEPSFTTDEFEGYAIAGKLPFKNVYSGDYADYVDTEDSPALWLTNADRLLAVEGLYFDISFIKNIAGDFSDNH